jgi:spore germination cell wall hydrolase CwlJ-like protein
MNGSLKIFTFIFGITLFTASVAGLYNLHYASDKIAKNDYESVSVAQMRKDLECLALNIYREGGYEPIEGRIAIAQVTMNRVDSKDFPNDVCGVVYQKNRVVTRTVCQFSWYCDASHRNRPINREAYDEAYEVAKKVYLEGFRLDSLTDALYYHADYINPRWKLERINQIGTHIFYRPKGADHPKLAGTDI